MDDPYYQLSRFGAALDLIRNHYVDPPDEAKLIEAALKAMAASLDPHSGYVSGEAYRLLQSRIKGEFAGVRGIESHVEGGDIGYIRIRQFVEMTAENLKSAMARVRVKIPPSALRGYILDLRNNPGGFVDEAIDTVNVFVGSGPSRTRPRSGPGFLREAGSRPFARETARRANQRRHGLRR